MTFNGAEFPSLDLRQTKNLMFANCNEQNTDTVILILKNCKENIATHAVFHILGEAKFAYGGEILGSSQFTLLPDLPLKMMLGLKVVKIDSKLSNSLC